MLQVDLVKQAKDIEAINVESCITEDEEIYIEKSWIKKYKDASISYINRCVNKKKVPEIQKIKTKKADINIEYIYPYTTPHKAKALNEVCTDTKTGMKCGTFKEAIKLEVCD